MSDACWWIYGQCVGLNVSEPRMCCKLISRVSHWSRPRHLINHQTKEGVTCKSMHSLESFHICLVFTTFTQLSQEILSGHFVSGFFRPTTNLKVLYAQFYLGGVVDGEVDGPVPGDNRQLTLVIFFWMHDWKKQCWNCDSNCWSLKSALSSQSASSLSLTIMWHRDGEEWVGYSSATITQRERKCKRYFCVLVIANRLMRINILNLILNLLFISISRN